jgi:hypothetical protein
MVTNLLLAGYRTRNNFIFFPWAKLKSLPTRQTLLRSISNLLALSYRVSLQVDFPSIAL